MAVASKTKDSADCGSISYAGLLRGFATLEVTILCVCEKEEWLVV